MRVVERAQALRADSHIGGHENIFLVQGLARLDGKRGVMLDGLLLSEVLQGSPFGALSSFRRPAA
jgi:hypothetical protein